MIRDASGNWQINTDSSGGTTFISEGSSFTDNTHTSSAVFGVYCRYTISNVAKFIFDDISVTTDASGFAIASVIQEGGNIIRISFNQNVDKTTAETVSNYGMDYGFANPVSAEQDMNNLNEVVLTFASDFVNNDYTINIDQVQNVTQDETINDTAFSFDVALQTPFRNIVINEIMADPSPAVGLPNAEYIELYNPSEQAINIGNFMIDARTIESFVLESDAYVTLTTSANAALFSDDVIGLSGLSLSNSGEALELTDNLGNLVDSVTFTTGWYNDTDKDDGGFALEQINPILACSNENNWTVSTNSNGGTPGAPNDVYDISPDVTGPNLINITANDASTFLLTFDEPMDETSLNGATYIFDNGIMEGGVWPVSPGFLSTTVDITPNLVSGMSYTISISGATDCAGNTIQSNRLSFTYDTNPPALDRIIVRNTNQLNLVFNEDLNKSTAEVASNYLSSHTGGNPSSAVLSDEDATIVSITFSDDFAINVQNTLTIDNLEDFQGNSLAVALNPTFTLSQQIDTIHVMGINLLDIYFKQEIDILSGIMTNRYFVDDNIGHPTTAFIDDTNDKLIHLAFTNSFDDNKDLTLSVSDIQNKSLDFLTTPDVSFVYDTAPPKLDTVKVISATSLAVVFTEKVKTQSAESKENYEYEGIYPVGAILKEDQKTVLLDFAEAFEREIVFELSIDEVKDRYGNEVKTKLKQEFSYDFFGPELDSIIARSPNELILWFNENLNQDIAENMTNYSIGSSIGQPTSAKLNLEHQHIVYLDLSSDLPESAGITVEISSMTDIRGNAIESTLSSTFDFDRFYVSAITPLSQNGVEIEFNKNPNTTTKNTLSNYTLNGDIAESIVFSSNRKAKVTFGSIVEDNVDQELGVKNMTDSNTDPLAITNYTFGFDSRISAASLLGDRSIELAFEVALEVDQTLSLADFSTTPSLGSCVSAIIDKEDSQFLRLTFQQSLVGDLKYEIAWKNLTNIYENRLPDYFITLVKDETVPSVSTYTIVDSQTLWLKYTEKLNEVSAEFLNNYKISPDVGFPSEATYQREDSTVLLEFSTGFSEGTNYRLTIDNIEDVSDNALMDYHIDFIYVSPNNVSFGDLIITEIMADPTPEVGLPDIEYIEIYNTTDQTISLAGIKIVDEGGAATIISGEIASNGYLILTSTAGASDFPNGEAIGVTSFPSLNNSGEIISLYEGETPIFSTSYNSDWYKDDDKEAGGWTLEMIDVTNPCGEIGNWTASIHETGGTPGQSNSVAASNPDNFGPKVVTALAISEDSLLVVMNEKLHPSSLTNTKISITPDLSVAHQALISPEHTQIGIRLADKLEVSQRYEIKVTALADCQMNIIQSDQNTASFRLPQPASLQDVIINEVLFNPKVGGVDFVEIYNNSDKAINLKNWSLADQVNDTKTITNENLVVNPEEYLVLTTDPVILESNYPMGDASRFFTMASFPGLSDTEDSVILINGSSLIIDEMKYEDDYHFNLLDDDDGVSLERVSFDAESNNTDSWKSAASTVGFATPGTVNSQFRAASQSTAKISIAPKVFVPDNTGMNDFTTITYQLDQVGNFANVHVYSTTGVLTKTLAEGELLSTRGFFTWDGVTNGGGKAAVGYYLIHFEIFDGNGNKSIRNETVVLGSKF